jgi:SAM-dependent methyltransferase
MPAEPGWEHLTACPICDEQTFTGSERFFLATMGSIEVGEAVIRLITKTEWTACSECGVEYQSKRLSPETLTVYYETDLYREFIDDGGIEAREKNTQRFARSVTEYLRVHEITATRHLDFGSALGALLRRVEWEGVGVELSSNAREWSRAQGVETHRDLSTVTGKFDLVTITETLEHLPDPVGTLRSLVALLEPGGRLLVTVPWAGKSMTSKLQIGHLFDFNASSMLYVMNLVRLTTMQVAEVSFGPRSKSMFYLSEKEFANA